MVCMFLFNWRLWSGVTLALEETKNRLKVRFFKQVDIYLYPTISILACHIKSTNAINGYLWLLHVGQAIWLECQHEICNSYYIIYHNYIIYTWKINLDFILVRRKTSSNTIFTALSFPRAEEDEEYKSRNILSCSADYSRLIPFS